MRPSLALAALAGLALSGSAASAAVVTYHGTFTVTNPQYVNHSHIAPGDVFYYQFSVNTSVVDTNPSLLGAEFIGLFTEFRMERALTNTGTWDPAASGTWGDSTGYADNNAVRALFQGWGLQSLEYIPQDDGPLLRGAPAWEWTDSAVWNPEFHAAYTDLGSGQTFEQMFGSFNATFISPSFYIDRQLGASNTAFGAGAHPNMVPEPSAVLLLGCGLGGFALRRRRVG